MGGQRIARFAGGLALCTIGLHESDHRYERDDGRAGEDGAQDAGASAEVGGVGLGGSLTFFCVAGLFFGVAQFGLALFFFGGRVLVFGVSAGGQIVAGAGQPIGESRCRGQCLGIGESSAGQ